MKTTVFAALCTVAVAAVVAAPKVDQSPKSKPRAPTYEEIRAQQTLGRVIASPDGAFFLYEWLRPYNWVRDTGSLPPAAANRMQAWLYKVDVDITPTTSQYLFHPGSGSSYWLGGLSPDRLKVSFYELDNDYNTVKAGVWNMGESKLTWFDVAPDAARLDQPASWASNDEVVYPAKTAGAQFVRANANTGVAKACTDCGGLLQKVRFTPQGVAAQPAARPGSDAPDANVLARSDEGDLAIYAKDTSEELTLIFQKGADAPETVFENKRR